MRGCRPLWRGCTLSPSLASSSVRQPPSSAWVHNTLYAPSEHPSRTQNPRHCSVLALISKRLDAVLDYPLVLLRLFYQAVRTREVHVESMLLRGHSSLTRWYATRNVGASASPEVRAGGVRRCLGRMRG